MFFPAVMCLSLHAGALYRFVLIANLQEMKIKLNLQNMTPYKAIFHTYITLCKWTVTPNNHNVHF